MAGSIPTSSSPSTTAPPRPPVGAASVTPGTAVHQDYGDGWQPRHAFLSVHPREMVQAFINLVDPVQAKQKLSHLIFGGGESGKHDANQESNQKSVTNALMFLAMALCFFFLLRLVKWRKLAASANSMEAAEKKK